MKQQNEPKYAQTPTEAETTWEEIGFAEFPIVTTSLKRPPTDTLEFIEEVGTDEAGKPVNRTWKMVGSTEYGLPRLPDLDIFVGILALLEQTGYRQRVVQCTLKDLCDITGVTPGGMTYERLKQGFLRFATTTYVAERVFRDPKTKVAVPLETWEIITESRFTDDSTVLPSFFEVGKRFLGRLQNGQRKPVDLGLWRELPLGLEKPMYHYLDKNLHGGKERHEIGLKKLSERIALSGTYGPAHLQRILRKPLENLTSISFLSQFRFEQSKSRQDPVKLVVFPGPRARGERRAARKGVSYQPDSQRAPERDIARNSRGQTTDTEDIEQQGPLWLPDPASADGDPAYKLVQRFHELAHASAPRTLATRDLKRAAQLLELQGSYELALFSVDYACAEARRTGFDIQNFGAVFANDYPGRARADYQARQERATQSRAAADERHARHKYEEWLDLQIDTRWRSLGPEVQEAAIKSADRLLVERAGRSGVERMTLTARRGTAERLARGKLGSDLPSFEEWRAGRKTGYPPSELAR